MSISTSTGSRTPAARRRGLDAPDIGRIVGADRDRGNLRQRREPGQLGVAHHLVADQDVGDAAPGQHLRLPHLLHALADRAGGNLAVRDDRRFVRLGVRPQLRAGRGEQRAHMREVVLEGVEVEQQRRRVDLVFAHAGLGGRGLEHAYVAALLRFDEAREIGPVLHLEGPNVAHGERNQGSSFRAIIACRGLFIWTS